MHHNLARSILEHIGLRLNSEEEHEKLVECFASVAEERCGKPVHPERGESLAMSVMTPKTAALAFDRVYRIPVMNEPVPTDIGFYGATVTEVAWWARALAIFAAEQVGIDYFGRKSANSSRSHERETLRFVTSELQTLFGRAPTIFYHSTHGYSGDFPCGTHQVLTATIRDIGLVDENSLTWDQVIEFRKDRHARAKYRRLVRWIDAELRTSSPSAVQDEIAIRIDDYEWAIRKHGIKATLGGLTSMLDPKFLGATSATAAAGALAGGEFWAALTAGSLLIGQAAVSAGTALVDSLEQRRKDNYEVAYIYEVRHALGRDA